ncbi:hypothetical protein [Bordetella genomosp. 4]|uniref:Uncharacterized protein n=1 Tax=Bordetella genomosp. 4 TaxID=463044 RepID=A0A261U679_9BORD|nr:hypothetical protein [Bordetella genomosp. 4]OZI56770.1 hypothetical protein CAL20_15330 [Bordetella genomosp. 4]
MTTIYILLALYVVLTIVIAFSGDWFYSNTWDLDIAGYAAVLVALVALSGVLGPTLDSEPIAKDGRGTAYAARQQ